MGRTAGVLLLLTGLLAAPAAAQRTYECEGRRATIVGTGDDDTIRGTRERDVIAGLGGDDVIKGLGGRDLVCGNRGNDSIYGNGVKGPQGNVSGPPQRLLGGKGDDTLYSGGGSILRGEGGRDRLVVDAAFSTAFAGPGHDTLDSTGGRGAYLAGGPGDDDVFGGSGRNDTLVFPVAPAPVRVDLAVQTASGQGSDTIRGIDHVIGGDGDDRIMGDEGANRLVGGGGRDFVDGRPGDDVLDGDYRGDSDSADELVGGSGNDWITPDVHSGADDVVTGGPGSDTYDVFLSPATVDLTTMTTSGEVGDDRLSGIENAVGAGYADRLIGDEGPNVLTGHGGRDFVDGNGGDDVITGEAGPGQRWYTERDDDTLRGGPGDDAITSEQGTDDVAGGAGNDTIHSGLGDDEVAGGEGDDDLDGAAGDDEVDGGPGNDTCRNAETTKSCESG